MSFIFFTFVFLKPDALSRDLVPNILSRLRKEELNIEIFTHIIVSQDKIFEHYAHKIVEEGSIYREKAISSFLGKPIIPIILSSVNKSIIFDVRKIIGATDPIKAERGTIRGDFGIDSMEKSNNEIRCCENLIHASDSIESFNFEITLWFGKEIARNFMCYELSLPSE